MEKIITHENLRSFAYCNDHIVKKPIRGIVLFFGGLNGNLMYNEDSSEARGYAEEGIIFLVPYQNPWAWMNRQTVDYTDELIDVLFAAHSLPENTPIVSTGVSMGGLSSLVYTYYAKRTPKACLANCPVCDLPFHFTERPDLPRTIYSAYGSYEGTLDEVLRTASPVHLAPTMPKDTAYYIFHCDADMAVNKQTHSDRFVAEMKKEHKIEYFEVPGRGHCDIGPEMGIKHYQCIINSIKG